MGAQDFEVTIYTQGSLQDAYQLAVEEALYEQGHDPYNGTISTTQGAVLSPLSDGIPVPENDLDLAAIEQRFDHISKWGSCEAIPILQTTPDKTEGLGQVTIETTIPSATLLPECPAMETRKAVHDAYTKAVRRAIRTDGAITIDGNMLKDAKTVPTPGATSDYTTAVAGFSMIQRPKITTKATTGKPETRYFIITEDQNVMPKWQDGYPSQAAARAALPTQTPGRHRYSPVAHYSIISMTRRNSGEPLVTHTLDMAAGKTTKVSIRGHVGRILQRGEVTDERGWYFYGLAAV